LRNEPWYATESKLRCTESNMDRNQIPSLTTILTAEQIQGRRNVYEKFLTVSHFFLNKTFEQVKGVPFLVAISDQLGYLIEIVGDLTIQNLMKQLGIKEGVLFNEKDCGTNSISLAIHHKIPIQLVGEDHFHTFLHGAACYTVPLKFTDTDMIEGTITIMTLKKHHNPLLFGLMCAVADSIERELNHK
jgi:transcriptional regulator of acetoin/glycerol metabolism